MVNAVVWAWKEFYRWLSSEDMGERLLGWSIVILILAIPLGLLFLFSFGTIGNFLFDTY